MIGRFIQLRLAAAVIGVMLWGYGYRVDSARLRWIAIAFLGVALLLRFLPRRFRGDREA